MFFFFVAQTYFVIGVRVSNAVLHGAPEDSLQSNNDATANIHTHGDKFPNMTS